jgi:hypothetical protein
VTEAEWLACTDLDVLLARLRRWQPSPRKLRLFAVACCRRIWPLLDDAAGRSQEAVLVSERFADGRASRGELLRAADRATFFTADPAEVGKPADHPFLPSEESYWWTDSPNAATAARCTAFTERDPFDVAAAVSNVAAYASLGAAAAAARRPAEIGPLSDAERAAQCDLLRDVFGNPFRPVFMEPAWLAADGGVVTAVARGLYEGDALGQLPILADVLEEVGCTDAMILGHARRAGPHVRGCWLVDRVLDKP